MTMKWTKTTIHAAFLSVTTALAFAACSESNPEPDDEDIITTDGGNGPTGDGDSDSDSDGDSDSDTATTNNGDGDGDGDETGGGSGPGGNGNTSGDGDGDGDNTGTGGNLGQEPEREDCDEEPNGDTPKLGDCWDLAGCNGVASEQFLNQCAGEGTCVGNYDNEANIEGFTGTLPPLN